MRIEANPWRRLGEIVGTVGVVAALALLSPGVRIVRAEDEARMSVDPGLVAAAEGSAPRTNPASTPLPASPAADPAAVPSPAAYPIVPASDVANASRPGVAGIEVQPGVVVLNTRGFNYGPPPTSLAPEALRQESAPR